MTADKADVRCKFNATKNTEGKRLASYQITLKDKAWDFDASVEIESKNGEIQHIAIEHKKQEEHTGGIKADKKKFVANASIIKNIQKALYPEDKVQKISMQYVCEKDNTLKRGNVKYIVKTETGEAVVYLYSMSTKSVYQMYRLEDASYLDKQKSQDELVCEVEIDG